MPLEQTITIVNNSGKIISTVSCYSQPFQALAPPHAPP